MAKSSAKRRPSRKPAVGLIMGSQSDWATMRHTAETLEALGVPLLYEFLNRYETNLFNRVAESLEFLKTLRTQNIKLLGDLFHMNIEEADQLEGLRLLLQFFIGIRRPDVRRESGRRLGFPSAGDHDPHGLVELRRKRLLHNDRHRRKGCPRNGRGHLRLSTYEAMVPAFRKSPFCNVLRIMRRDSGWSCVSL